MIYLRLVVTVTLASMAATGALAQTPQRTTATYGDWTVRCERHDSAKVCEMAQAMQIKGRPQPISQIAIGRQDKKGAMKIIFEVPINVWLRDGVTLAVDDEEATIKASFTRCIPAGCFAEADLKQAAVDKFRQPKKSGRLQFKDAARQKIAIPVSFKGFPAAYDALNK